jgi:hypothetical protein
MTIKTAAMAPLAWGRHCLRVLRSLSPAAVIAVTLAVVVGGAGFADAATGGNFILGKANSETSTARLSNSKGTPLKLFASANVAPLAVNRTALVANLNANYLGGLSAANLQPTGGDGFTPPGTRIPLPAGPATLVASTGALTTGTYYVTATAFLSLTAGAEGTCVVRTASNPNENLAIGGSSGALAQAAETVAVSVTAGDILQEWCGSTVTNGSAGADYAGITAIRILSSSGTTPAATGARASHHSPVRHSG